ncbi:MAG: class Ib ribonucleoside-diphosphate reductase assembly flavoprotein NrdI [Fusobacteriales bacterium]|jgi:protein involved in ribonucleotide reduction|nr:class Ib ribonucleoside-diphosphate reductase assembly flavoprotein NrdI [Fusobacteriales bacterium]
MKYIYYDSKTGNVERFINKIRSLKSWIFIKINEETVAENQGHLVTFTTNFGEVSKTTEKFLLKNNEKMLSVSSSGNMNWGKLYALAADKISEHYNIPVILKFELTGLNSEVETFIRKVEEIR